MISGSENSELLCRRVGKDIELRSMAKFLAAKRRTLGMDQQLGPLNPDVTRLVTLAVAEVPRLATTESVGDAFAKTVAEVG